METIYALASAQGKAGVSIVRLSGEKAQFILEALSKKPVPQAGHARLRRLYDSQGAILDEALVIFFRSGASFTGEDVVELHLHGSIAIVRAVLQQIAFLKVARLAEPGEFTRRALLNGQMDLTEVEGLADLIDAETEVQRREAIRVFSGGLKDKIEGWRHRLIRSAALIEATIDFADEEVPENVYPEVQQLLQSTSEEIANELKGVQAAQELRRGFEVAIIGAPNAGKSTLLNALAGREAAIISDVAGTTRDIVEVRLDIEGLPVTLLDTAGIRETDDVVEAIGVKRALERSAQADLRIYLSEAGDFSVFDPEPFDLLIETKADITGRGISAEKGIGVDQLLEEIAGVLSERVSNAGLVSRERDRISLLQSSERLNTAISNIGYLPEELITAELYGAVKTLEAVIGRVGVEDVLDEVFSSFCLGK